ncbi:hypothetical protein J4E90_007306 [Alternaria incomplexa]|uniref:uncharacterized protein n=1 Tax=Alternaria incomplexa TaxID=1187928 RepID=UPI00221F6B54|nr:uncharacterized protein J4E90_007306 [Alternaria incomplexa]XP_051302785.1 uncharacterized protein J4E86_005484 [Alternaria arbusti]KAI4911049.1 hypothetical protein J4E90_007306 [Alternaria incomplexa]KAI4957012.1 hypothetical protein J4E86_005484 [Alternaria arbusti]
MESSLQLPDHTCLPFRGVENDDKAFRPLNPESREIRCVILLPGSGADPIACELVYTSIDKDNTTRVEYVALSYCWGDVEDTVEISLQGPTTKSSDTGQEPITAPFRITRHLHSALTALRNERRQCFWIDALCINQQDPHEKTHQVQFMGNIYSSAESVLVWLGPEDGYSRYLLRAWRAHLQPLVYSYDSKTLVDKIYEELCKSTHTLWTDLERDEALSELALDLDQERLDETASPDRYKQALWVSFDGLFSRPWWSRIWVVQEVYLAPMDEEGGRKVEFRIGDHVLHWKEIMLINMTLLHIIRLPDDYNPATLPSWDEIWNRWKFLIFMGEANKQFSLSQLLKLTSVFHASDPRDKLFALLLLATDTRDCFRQEPLINPDYTKPAKAVFDDLMIFWELNLKTHEIHFDEGGVVYQYNWLS